MCPTVICETEFYVNLLVIDIYGVDVILWWVDLAPSCRNRLSKRRIVFKIPSHLEFEFARGNSSIEPPEYRACPMEGELANLYAIPIENIVELEFIDVFKDFLGLFQTEKWGFSSMSF